MFRIQNGETLNSNPYARRRLRGAVALLAVGTAACTKPAGTEQRAPAQRVCSPIVKIEQIDRPLSWGERTLDEVAAGAKFRSVYLVLDQHDIDTHRTSPHEISLERGFALSEGSEFCE